MKELTQEEKDRTLKNFMQEFFPFDEFLKIGLFKPEWRNDFKAQAKRVCDFFGFDSVYEYGAKEIRCHITYADGHRPKNEPFVTEFKSIYNE